MVQFFNTSCTSEINFLSKFHHYEIFFRVMLCIVLTLTVSSLLTTLFKGFSQRRVGELGHDKDLLLGFRASLEGAKDDFKIYLLVRFFNSTSPLKITKYIIFIWCFACFKKFCWLSAWSSVAVIFKTFLYHFCSHRTKKICLPIACLAVKI